jgi:hypothetical protein
MVRLANLLCKITENIIVKNYMPYVMYTTFKNTKHLSIKDKVDNNIVYEA